MAPQIPNSCAKKKGVKQMTNRITMTNVILTVLILARDTIFTLLARGANSPVRYERETLKLYKRQCYGLSIIQRLLFISSSGPTFCVHCNSVMTRSSRFIKWHGGVALNRTMCFACGVWETLHFWIKVLGILVTTKVDSDMTVK